MEYQSKKNRRDKLRMDRTLAEIADTEFSSDVTGLALTKGDRTRLSELIKWARWSCYLLLAIAAMLFLFFLRDALTVLVNLIGG